MRAEQVGGEFWQAPYEGEAPTVILRPAALGDVKDRMDETPAHSLWVLPRHGWGRAARRLLRRHDRAWASEIDPWSVLNAGTTLYAHGDDEWLALAYIAGAGVRIMSTGRFGTDGSTQVAVEPILRGLIETAYRDPFTERAVSARHALSQLSVWRSQIDVNRTIAVACGFAWWKRHEIAHFLWAPRPLRFVRSPRKAVAIAARQRGSIAIWPSRVSDRLLRDAGQRQIPLVRIEDGFIRSVGLGANLFPPQSVTLDRRGIHYDPHRPSDLEHLLETSAFSPQLLHRAESLRDEILRRGISKYGAGHRTSGIFPDRSPERPLILVPGQVEDDLSVRHAGGDVAGNLDLLRRVRSCAPDAEIWFRPHPDVDTGHRLGAVRDCDALELADHVVRGGSMASLLDIVDEVHVLTSLTGFEALLRNRAVTCHGTPFYAGWGLTRDLAGTPPRRTRRLTLAELMAGVLIVYPRYLDPLTNLPCPPEVLIDRMATQERPRPTWLTRIRAFQGLFIKLAAQWRQRMA